MVQLLLGNVGMPAAVNALRGHSNIQGLTDLGLLSNSPGYLTLPATPSRTTTPTSTSAHPNRCVRGSCRTGRTTASSTSA
jgi:anaerobic selenocysteine-containing dehydrogenase